MAKERRKAWDHSRRTFIRGAVASGITLAYVGGVAGLATMVIREGKGVTGAKLLDSMLFCFELT